jgi:hypothetical protein
MFKKLGIYLSIFFLLVAVNIVLLTKSNYFVKRDESIKRILKEIAENNISEKQFNHTNVPLVLGVFTTEVKIADGRVANLKNFFRKYNSPLYDEAEYIVEVSDRYQFDYRLLPAIAMQESNLCKFIPDNSHNCWGWGIYGTTVTKFPSYKEAIETVAKGIKRDYIDKGLVTASAIMQKYTPSSNGSWAHGVNTFLKMLE